MTAEDEEISIIMPDWVYKYQVDFITVFTLSILFWLFMATRWQDIFIPLTIIFGYATVRVLTDRSRNIIPDNTSVQVNKQQHDQEKERDH